MRTKRYLLICLVLFGSLKCPAQKEKVKELLPHIKTLTNQPDSLEYYGKKLLDLSGNLAKLEGYFAIGYAYFLRGEMQPAILNYDSSLLYIDPSEQYQLFKRVMRNKGLAERMIGNLEESDLTFGALIENAESIGDEKGVALVLDELGANANAKGQSEEALRLHKKSMTRWLELSEVGAMKSVLNVGKTLERMGEYESATPHFLKVLSIAKKNGQLEASKQSRVLLSENYRKRSMPDSSNFFFGTLARQYAFKKDSRSLIKTLIEQSENFIALDQIDSATSVLNLAYHIADTSDNKNFKPTILLSQGRLAIKNGKPQSAFLYYDSAILKAISRKDIQLAKRATRVMLNELKRQNNPETLSDYQNLNNLLRENLQEIIVTDDPIEVLHDHGFSFGYAQPPGRNDYWFLVSLVSALFGTGLFIIMRRRKIKS